MWGGNPPPFPPEASSMASNKKELRSETVRNLHAAAEPKQLSGLVKTMAEMRKQGALCDVTLVVQERRFAAHRLVLAAGSEFFRLMFTTNMMESVSPEVELKGVDPEIIELLIDYIYTAEIKINVRNVQSLLHVASQYQIQPVQAMCEEFLMEKVNVTNCMGIWALAHAFYCEGLRAKAETFLLKYFTESSTLVDFLQLPVNCLSKILSNDKLSVPEEQIYEAALRWLKHDLPNRRQHLAEVLSCIRFPLMSTDFLFETVPKEPLIGDSPWCLSMVIGAVNSRLNWRDHKDPVETCRPRMKKRKHISLFGYLKPDPCRFFNPKDSKWTAIHCSLEKRWNAAAVYLDDEVFILGGSTCQGLVRRVDCYNIAFQRMYSRTDLPMARNKLAACVSQGKIYISGGMVVNQMPVSLFESFDIKTNSWQVETELLTARCCHGSVEVNGLIYVCGGGLMRDRFWITNTCQVYDPSSRQWTEVRPMSVPRKNHGLVAVGNHIYAIGGKDHEGPLKSVEKYDVVNDFWLPCQPMPCPLMVKCAAVDDVIYVLAGKGNEKLRRVLKYNTRTDKWTVCHTVPSVPFQGSVICTVEF
ncbi:PREDICTED: kelch-like protein 7 isoform X1 [Cyprinodon variegatus]|uniref:kelch-like protein 7 isoform X1 n=2 Tax=Cyprinodon variegatus TaxID=28743 RepID=UPI000742A1F5|nr:PREDICTED: kelch-like protein 7 isoform X1 [Cyprinodon variegatus]